MTTVAKERSLIGLPPETLHFRIPVRKLQDVETERVMTPQSLSYPFIERNMAPNAVAKLNLAGASRWKLISPYSSYTLTEHLMAVRVGEEYTPDPTRVPDLEGEELMAVMAGLARGIGYRSYNEMVVWGYHCSPWSFRQEGGQSVPTIFHPYVFGLPALENSTGIEYLATAGLSHKDRKAVRGGIFNQEFGEFLSIFLRDQFSGDRELLNQLTDLDQAQTDYRGLRVPLRRSLDQVLGTPGFFRDILKPLAFSLQGFACDLSQAFTNFKPDYVAGKIKEAVDSRLEPDDPKIVAILDEITQTPQLLDKDQRAKNIIRLAQGYPPRFVECLQTINARLPEQGPASRWKRGFSYTVATIEDQKTGEGFLAINTAVENGPNGVIEGVLGAKLTRPDDISFTEEDRDTLLVSYRELIGGLPDLDKVTLLI